MLRQTASKPILLPTLQTSVYLRRGLLGPTAPALLHPDPCDLRRELRAPSGLELERRPEGPVGTGGLDGGHGSHGGGWMDGG